MTYTTEESAEAVTLTPVHTTASVIWLHGLGADGHDFVPIVPQLRLPDAAAVRFVFPHAPRRAVTLNNGYEMRAWYDITSLDAAGRDDAPGLAASVTRIAACVQAEQARGVAARRIVVAGFSQGGAVALHAGLAAPERLAGVLGLSTYLPLATQLRPAVSAANRDVPILMCHGTADPVVPPELGRAARDTLVRLGYTVEWREYRMRHEVCAPEITDVTRWLESRLA